MPKGQHFCYTIGMTAYEKIYEQAADNYGFITTRDAVELGVPKSEMSALAKRKRLVHKGYGDIATRVTKDMDAAQGSDLDAFLAPPPGVAGEGCRGRVVGRRIRRSKE